MFLKVRTVCMDLLMVINMGDSNSEHTTGLCDGHSGAVNPYLSAPYTHHRPCRARIRSANLHPASPR